MNIRSAKGTVHLRSSVDPYLTWCGRDGLCNPEKTDDAVTCKICLKAIENRRFRLTKGQEQVNE